MTLGNFRSVLYRLGRLLGDVQAVRRWRIGQRLWNRVVGRVAGRLLRRLFR